MLNEYQAKLPPNEPELTQKSWITVVNGVVIDPTLPEMDAGEAAAISLALKVGARLILLDERKARRIATSLELPTAGTLAILLRAKNYKLIPAIQPIIREMQNQGRWFHADLIMHVLNDAGE